MGCLFPLLLREWKDSWVQATNSPGELKCKVEQAWGAGYEDGDPLTMSLTQELSSGEPWSLRDYQVDAIDAFHGGASGGSGVVVLPCGAGKTLVGVASMVRLGMRTLILCTGQAALQQWKRHILEHTTLTEDQVGEFTGRQRRHALPRWASSRSSSAWSCSCVIGPPARSDRPMRSLSGGMRDMKLKTPQLG